MRSQRAGNVSQRALAERLGMVGAVNRHLGALVRELKRRGAKRVVFYRAGVVMEVTYLEPKAAGLDVVGVVDDDPAKQGRARGRLRVLAPAAINWLAPDAVVITTFRHAREIQRRLDPALRPSVLVWEL